MVKIVLLVFSSLKYHFYFGISAFCNPDAANQSAVPDVNNDHMPDQQLIPAINSNPNYNDNDQVVPTCEPIQNHITFHNQIRAKNHNIQVKRPIIYDLTPVFREFRLLLHDMQTEVDKLRTITLDLQHKKQ